MALWSVSAHSSMQDGQLAEDVPVIEPIFTFSNLSSEAHTLTTNEERVRSLAYCHHNYVCQIMLVCINNKFYLHRNLLPCKLILVELTFTFGMLSSSSRYLVSLLSTSIIMVNCRFPKQLSPSVLKMFVCK